MTCLAVAGGIASPPGARKQGDFTVDPLNPGLVEKGLKTAKGMVERAIDTMKTSAEDVPVILVGGGSSILDISQVNLEGGRFLIFVLK